jgi:signal transduction histidine kinase
MLPRWVVGIIAAGIFISPSWAGEFGTGSDAAALIKRVQIKFANDGPAATFAAITNGAPDFVEKDLYVFIYDLNGTLLAHGGNPALVGQNRRDLRDANGKLVVSEIIDVAKQSGRGSVDYAWPNPVAVDDMSSYIERLGDNYIVGVPTFRSDKLRPMQAQNQR